VILGDRALGLGFSLFLLQFSFYPASNNLVWIVHTYANCMWGTLSGESIVVILARHLACRSDFTWLRVKVLQAAMGSLPSSTERGSAGFASRVDLGAAG
jgi:hypothetical protein